MKRILLSVLTISLVGAVTIGATGAYFSDTETSTGNTFTAGTIDLSKPTVFAPFLVDYKPSETGYIGFSITNVGGNEMDVWKHIVSAVTADNGVNEPECVAYGGTWSDTTFCTGGTLNDAIDTVTLYDMWIEKSTTPNTVFNDGVDQWIIQESEGLHINDVVSNYIYLGKLAKGATLNVVQSYHMAGALTGNWAQSDTMTLNIEFFGQQLGAPVPGAELSGHARP